jgi:hypothetical protein
LSDDAHRVLADAVGSVITVDVSDIGLAPERTGAKPAGGP